MRRNGDQNALPHLTEETERWAMVKLASTVVLLCCLWSSLVTSLSFLFLWSWLYFCATHCQTVWGGVEEATEGKPPRGNRRPNSLCDSISRLYTLECMPRHLSLEPRNESWTRKALARTRRHGKSYRVFRDVHTHIDTKRSKTGNYVVKTLTNKYAHG